MGDYYAFISKDLEEEVLLFVYYPFHPDYGIFLNCSSKFVSYIVIKRVAYAIVLQTLLYSLDYYAVEF